jgi:HEAT repeat protein
VSDVLKLKEMLSSNDVDDAYDALIDIGKSNRQELINDIKKFLTHEEPDLQRAAIMVLGTYWKVPDFKHELPTILTCSPDDDVRVTALVNWIGYYQGTEDKGIIFKLNDLLRDSNEDIYIRIEAFRSMGRVAKFDINEDIIKSLERATSYAEFENLIPWGIVDELIGPLK